MRKTQRQIDTEKWLNEYNKRVYERAALHVLVEIAYLYYFKRWYRHMWE